MLNIESIINNELEKYKLDIEKIDDLKSIDCVTIFSNSEEDYNNLNSELSNNIIIDKMSSGNLYYLKDGIDTIYGKLNFIKIRKYDGNYVDYRISVDFIVGHYEQFKSNIDNPVIKKYDTFELIQFKNKNSIINVISLSARDDYKIN